MLTVEVFKTNVDSAEDAERIIQQILQRDSALDVNFDLDDCDRILRVDGGGRPVMIEQIHDVVRANGFHSETLA